MAYKGPEVDILLTSAIATSLIGGVSEITAAWLRQRGTATRRREEERQSSLERPQPGSCVIDFYGKDVVIEVRDRVGSKVRLLCTPTMVATMTEIG
jgi:hypothetical protein